MESGRRAARIEAIASGKASTTVQHILEQEISRLIHVGVASDGAAPEASDLC
jgi:hypothetical protein